MMIMVKIMRALVMQGDAAHKRPHAPQNGDVQDFGLHSLRVEKPAPKAQNGPFPPLKSFESHDYPQFEGFLGKSD